MIIRLFDYADNIGSPIATIKESLESTDHQQKFIIETVAGLYSCS